MEAFTGDRARTTRPPPHSPSSHSPSSSLTLLPTHPPSYSPFFPFPFFPPHFASFSSSRCVLSEVVSPNIHISKEQSAPAFFMCNTRSSERSLTSQGRPAQQACSRESVPGLGTCIFLCPGSERICTATAVGTLFSRSFPSVLQTLPEVPPGNPVGAMP